MQWQAHLMKALLRCAINHDCICIAGMLMWMLPVVYQQVNADELVCIVQLIGNSIKSWKTYYDLNRVLREGQAA